MGRSGRGAAAAREGGSVMRSAHLPDTATLEGRLAEALGCSSVRVIERQPNPQTSTFPSEIAKLELADRAMLHAFLKYESGGSNGSHGHRGGVPYEASVNRILLRPLGVSVPEYYGFYADGHAGQSFLITEYMTGSLRVSKSAGSAAAMMQAAEWLGQFHARGEQLLGRRPVPGLQQYDRAYYLGWSRRAEQATVEASGAAEWFQAAVAGFRQSVDALLCTDASPIHGEYYPKNILVHDGRIRPIDWESAAVAAGEVDLAALIEKWPAETVELCQRAYEQARWPGGAPPDWRRRLRLAQLYLQFRWLAAGAWRRAPDPASSWRLGATRSVSASLGFT
ncbi:MAG: Phosphotransferase enzyme family [Solirubrobacterales bacterium]|nr:Phosphotransferase enzyme family [Solirubrobacterales bacterium]